MIVVIQSMIQVMIEILKANHGSLDEFRRESLYRRTMIQNSFVNGESSTFQFSEAQNTSSTWSQSLNAFSNKSSMVHYEARNSLEMAPPSLKSRTGSGDLLDFSLPPPQPVRQFSFESHDLLNLASPSVASASKAYDPFDAFSDLHPSRNFATALVSSSATKTFTSTGSTAPSDDPFACLFKTN